jgi:hypothetical protein
MKIPAEDLYREEPHVTRLLRSPVPHPDESLMGYIIRLTEENGYDTPSWIFDLAGLKTDAGRGGWSAFYRPDFDPAPLARVLGLTCSEFDSLKYGEGPGTRSVIFSDRSLPVEFIRFSAPKVCPACLRQANYYRRSWDLLPLTACPNHGLMLIDVCTGCGRRISWSRRKVSVCRCGFDWRNCRPSGADADALEASRQVFRLCQQTDLIPAGEGEGNPLYGLSLENFCRALTLLAGYHLFIGGGGWLKSKTENRNCHEAYSRAWRAFAEWPAGFYRFLFEVRHRTGRRVSESRLYRQAVVQCDTPPLYFMYIACEDFVEACEREELQPGFTRPPTFRRFIDRDEASRRYGITEEGFDLLTRKDKLVTVPHPSRCDVLIDANSIELLRMSLCHLLTLADIAKLLWTEPCDVEELVHEGMLRPVSGRGVDMWPKWRFDQDDIVDLINKVGNKLAGGSTSLGDNTVLVRAAIREMKARGVGAGRCVRAILDGKIVARKGRSPFPHIPRFVFIKGHLSKGGLSEAAEGEHVGHIHDGPKRNQPFDYKVRARALKAKRNISLRMTPRRTVKKALITTIDAEVTDLARIAWEVFSRTLSQSVR